MKAHDGAGPQQAGNGGGSFDDSQWDTAMSASESGPLTPGQNAIFRTIFDVSAMCGAFGDSELRHDRRRRVGLY